MNHNFTKVTYYSGFRFYNPDNTFVDFPFPEVLITKNRNEINNLIGYGIAGILLYALFKK